MIPLKDCVTRDIYTLGSRNLVLGVFRERTGGFVGIREKFGDFYLFEEYHWEMGPPYGTAVPYEVVGRVPDSMSIEPRGATIDYKTNREVEYDREQKGWYFIDTKEFSREIRPMSLMNKELYSYLRNIEETMKIRDFSYEEPPYDESEDE